LWHMIDPGPEGKVLRYERFRAGFGVRLGFWPPCPRARSLFSPARSFFELRPAGFLTPGSTPAYFTNFSYLLRHVGNTYYVSRLPWILPGLLAFRLAPPEAASVALNTAIVTVSAVALYWTVRWHYGRWCGILAAVLLVASPHFHGHRGLGTIPTDRPSRTASRLSPSPCARTATARATPFWRGLSGALPGSPTWPARP